MIRASCRSVILALGQRIVDTGGFALQGVYAKPRTSADEDDGKHLVLCRIERHRIQLWAIRQSPGNLR
jgi:hypothetical protein